MLARSVLVVTLALASVESVRAQDPPAPGPDSVPAAFDLFNGRDLDGLFVYAGDAAVPADELCRVEEGMIRITGAGRGYIRTVNAFADYKLHLEWRWPAEGGNSGLMLHCVNRDLLWPKGFEAQLGAGRAGDFYSFVDARSREERVSRNPTGYSTGRLPRTGPANVEKPLGQWNAYDVLAEGDAITLSINGVEVNRYTDVVPNAGMIALQAEGTPIDFRNFKIELLPPAKDLHAPMPDDGK